LSALLASATTTHDQAIRRLIRATGTTLGLTPRADRVTATGGAALTTAVRVINRVHDNATNLRAATLPAHTAGLTPVDVALLSVTDLADRGAAADKDIADLARGHTKLGVIAFLRDQLDGRTRRTRDLGAATGAQFDRVNNRTQRDVTQRQV